MSAPLTCVKIAGFLIHIYVAMQLSEMLILMDWMILMVAPAVFAFGNVPSDMSDQKKVANRETIKPKISIRHNMWQI